MSTAELFAVVALAAGLAGYLAGGAVERRRQERRSEVWQAKMARRAHPTRERRSSSWATGRAPRAGALAPRPYDWGVDGPNDVASDDHHGRAS